MLSEVDEHYPFRDAVEDVLGAGVATPAEALFAAQFFGQAAQARYAVRTKNIHV